MILAQLVVVIVRLDWHMSSVPILATRSMPVYFMVVIQTQTALIFQHQLPTRPKAVCVFAMRAISTMAQAALPSMPVIGILVMLRLHVLTCLLQRVTLLLDALAPVMVAMKGMAS
jgi:hypothetical protein